MPVRVVEFRNYRLRPGVREAFFEDQARLGEKLPLVEIAGDDGQRPLGRRDVQVAKQVPHVVQIMELFSETHGGALHRQQVLGSRHEHLEMRELEEGIELSPRTQIGLDRIVQPCIGHARLRRNPRGGFADETS